MGRELKRVPLDFAWPCEKPWKGFRSGRWRKEPPTGPGYQIWETVSGSPISPVFETPEALARFMAGRKWGADPGSSYETWLAFIQMGGRAPSLIFDGAKVVFGVQEVVDGAKTP